MRSQLRTSFPAFLKNVQKGRGCSKMVPARTAPSLNDKSSWRFQWIWFLKRSQHAVERGVQQGELCKKMVRVLSAESTHMSEQQLTRNASRRFVRDDSTWSQTDTVKNAGSSVLHRLTGGPAPTCAATRNRLMQMVLVPTWAQGSWTPGPQRRRSWASCRKSWISWTLSRTKFSRSQTRCELRKSRRNKNWL